MVLIKKLSLKNWADERRLPDNIIVIRKEPLWLRGQCGAVVRKDSLSPRSITQYFWIVTVSGGSYGPCDGVEALILKWQWDFDFYYIEIKP